MVPTTSTPRSSTPGSGTCCPSPAPSRAIENRPGGGTPAGFLGFASTAGTVAATGSAVNDPVSWQHPSVLVAGAFVVGVAFGMASEYLLTLLTGSAGAPATA
ncbi:DUF1097 family protein [Gordonia sp. C13]|uniref:DUF1097 family protein n=1 Tax=Gordonia sp. C13 TaxID=2935078 RepID=UPI00200A7E1E|nr:DUF1097 family protein [Gordonia sp. C13]MCK8612366.1 DUF1097 domain-containing protein [Gordonia sp. C13]